MSERYPGGYITKTPPAPTQTSASGVWTLDQALQNVKGGTWPPNGPFYVEDVFSTYLYTGNGTSQTITNGIDLSGEGGLVWIKQRSLSYTHALVDTVRGTDKVLCSNNTNAEQTGDPGFVTQFNSNGFAIGDQGRVNLSTYDFASWTFRQAEKFFDVVTWTGNGSTQAINHNLGSTPGCIIAKCTSNSGSWRVYHTSESTKYGNLNSTVAFQTISAEYVWGNNSTTVAPTSTNFTVGNDVGLNGSGETYVAYLFAHNAGGFGDSGSESVIKCGKLDGDGTVDLGWEPQWILWKRYDNTSNWILEDTMRGLPVDSDAALLNPNLSSAESAVTAYIRPNATGFTQTGLGWNIIYIAIRRGPMKTPTTGTSVFSPNLTAATTGTAITTGFPVDLQIQGVRPNYGLSVSNAFLDRLRGVSSNATEVGYFLAATSTSAEDTGNTSFRTLGFGNSGYNQDGYLSGTGAGIYWNFRRAPGFFDEVCYTGNATARTISHNLGVAPEMMIVKSRSNNIDWSVYVQPLGTDQQLFLNLNSAKDGTSTVWNDTAPTSSVFSVGTSFRTNTNNATYVAYLFASVAGVSKVGSYTGTGTTLQVNCGFTGGARFVMIKRTDSTGDWYVWDSARGIVAGNDPYLLLNSTAAEVTNTDYVDTYSAGFEISSTAPAAINANGGTFIFLAIA